MPLDSENLARIATLLANCRRGPVCAQLDRVDHGAASADNGSEEAVPPMFAEPKEDRLTKGLDDFVGLAKAWFACRPEHRRAFLEALQHWIIP